MLTRRFVTLLLAVLFLAVPVASKAATDGKPAQLPQRTLFASGVPGVEALLGIEPTPASTCSVSLNCGDGNQVSCQGGSSCIKQAGQCYVQCDGNQSYCPNTCTVVKSCSSSGAIFCTSCAGDCDSGQGWVECDGMHFDCPDIHPRFP